MAAGDQRVTLTLHGAAGRMGAVLRTMVADSPSFGLASLWDRPDHPGQGRPLDQGGPPLTAAWASAPGDVVIDFSTPAAVDGLLAAWPAAGPALVCCTTGLSPETLSRLRSLAATHAVFHSSNMSIGVALLHRLAALAARMVGADWEVELVEMHHNRKVDAPSGTAMSLVETVRKAWPEPLEPRFGREGLCGPRRRQEIGVLALRGGGVVGEHELIFAGPAETVRISHRAQSREIFAAGALRAASWMAGREAGFYGMEQMLEG